MEVIEDKISVAVVDDNKLYAEELKVNFLRYTDDVEVFHNYDDVKRKTRCKYFNIITLDTIPSGNITGLCDTASQLKKIVEEQKKKTTIIGISSSKKEAIKSADIDGYKRKVIEPARNVEEIIKRKPDAKRIIVVEDNKDLAEEYREYYLKYVNECIIIDNYNELLSKVRQEDFDVITLEAIPGGDPAALLNVARQLKECKVKGSIIAVSSLKEDKIKSDYIDAYISKVLPEDEIVREIVKEFTSLDYEYEIFVEGFDKPKWFGCRNLQEHFDEIRKNFPEKRIYIKWNYIKEGEVFYI